MNNVIFLINCRISCGQIIVSQIQRKRVEDAFIRQADDINYFPMIAYNLIIVYKITKKQQFLCTLRP